MRLNKLLLILVCSVSLWGDWMIIDTTNSQKLTKDELIQRIGENRNILLGEQHRNEEHHRLRGELIASFDSRNTVVVAEHLDIGKKVVWLHELQTDLEQGSFSTKGWKWPIHQSLFAPLKQNGIELIGGNITRENAKAVAMGGVDKLENTVAEILKATPYDAKEAEILANDIKVGHCNALPEGMLAPMSLAQQAKDSAMSLTLHRSQKPMRFLVAGNGHVRKDYGVPRILKSLYPEEKTLSIGFVEEEEFLRKNAKEYRDLYDVIVVAGNSPHEDHCAKFQEQMQKKQLLKQ
jgi:uncharacterized iron-regulated protein